MIQKHGGELTEKDIADFWDAFKLVDEDNNGEISVKELGLILQTLGQNPSRKELEEMIATVDKNGNMEIDFGEFLELMSEKMKDTDAENEMVESFMVFDRDGNGLIGEEELKQTMLGLGIKVGNKEIAAMLQHADEDKDDHLNYAEFVKIMMKR